MNYNALMIIIILAAGGVSIGVSYASTIITDATIIVNNLTVTGTCTGCGGGDGSFTTWTLIQQTNFTESGCFNGSFISLDNNGNSLFTCNNVILITNGGSITNFGSNINQFTQAATESSTGKYKTFTNGTGTQYNIPIISNSTLIHSIIVNASVFKTPSQVINAISPSGEYITLKGNDICNCGHGELQIWKGS